MHGHGLCAGVQRGHAADNGGQTRGPRLGKTNLGKMFFKDFAVLGRGHHNDLLNARHFGQRLHRAQEHRSARQGQHLFGAAHAFAQAAGYHYSAGKSQFVLHSLPTLFWQKSYAPKTSAKWNKRILRCVCR